MIDLDFTHVGREMPIIEEGDHLLTVANIEQKKSKDPSKSDSLHVSLQDETGKKVMDFFALHPNALWKLRLFLEAVTGSEIEGGIQIDEKELIGMPVMATVTIEERQDGKGKQNRIQAYGAA